MGTIMSPPETEQEAIALLRRVVWYLSGKKVRLVGPAILEYGAIEFRVCGATLRKSNKTDKYYVVVFGVDNKVTTAVAIRQFNELELI